MKFNVVKLGKDQWEFQIVAGNGKILARSEETYTRKRSAVEGVAIIKAGAPFAKTEEVA
jgi:uncharacterized protein YegP (UPF0339 family)